MTATFFHRSLDGSPIEVRWLENSPLTASFAASSGTVSFRHGVMQNGKATGVEVIFVDTGAVRVLVLPTRGMGIWKMWVDNVEFGWDSPIDGPVHPSLVPVADASGLGWLEGFDELVVRCGLESNGAPEKDEQGHVRFPLHGRIANLPASNLSIHVDEQSGQVELIGEVFETRLFFQRLRLRARLKFRAGSSVVGVVDEVTNQRSVPATIQMLYHINVGSPVLSDRASLQIPVHELAPKDALSAGEMDQWNRFGSPQIGYSERVYFSRPASDSSGWAAALLRSGDDRAGLGVRFDTRTLPYFILWKNTAGASDGYVTGLEPATNLPNTRSFETQQDRVVHLAADQTVHFQLELHPLIRPSEVAAFAGELQCIEAGAEGHVHTQPKPGWSM